MTICKSRGNRMEYSTNILPTLSRDVLSQPAHSRQSVAKLHWMTTMSVSKGVTW